MRIYVLDKRAEAGTSFGYEFFTSKREAVKAFREWMGTEEEGVLDRETTKIAQYDIELTKEGVLRALRLLATHPNNW